MNCLHFYLDVKMHLPITITWLLARDPFFTSLFIIFIFYIKNNLLVLENLGFLDEEKKNLRS